MKEKEMQEKRKSNCDDVKFNEYFKGYSLG
jgi:hypothetical protein